MAPEWAVAAGAALAAGPAAMVTVLATEGSAPREAGTRMIVTADGAHGTIGGGALEHRAIAQARAVLDHPPGTWRVQDYPLGVLLGQCCGGRVRLLVERLDPAGANWLGAVREGATLVTRLERGRVRRAFDDALTPEPIAARGPLPGEGSVLAERIEAARLPLFLFGAGHIGRAIATLCKGLPIALAWYDTRPEAGEQPGVVLASEDEVVACAGTGAAQTATLILTHDHALDYRLVAAALRSEARFVGLIGSATKRARFVSRLGKAGIDPARLTCPIGIAGIAGKVPEVIAVAVVAQLLALPGAAA